MTMTYYKTVQARSIKSFLIVSFNLCYGSSTGFFKSILTYLKDLKRIDRWYGQNYQPDSNEIVKYFYSVFDNFIIIVFNYISTNVTLDKNYRKPQIWEKMTIVEITRVMI